LGKEKAVIPTSSEEPPVIFSDFVRGWFRLLAEGRFANATAQLDEPNHYGVIWGENQIRSVLLEYGGTRSATISDPNTAAGTPHSSHGAFNDGSGYWFCHDVPLDGAWSDLQAQFEFIRKPTGFAVVLHDMIVA
jgi:hypothetical protein